MSLCSPPSLYQSTPPLPLPPPPPPDPHPPARPRGRGQAAPAQAPAHGISPQSRAPAQKRPCGPAQVRRSLACLEMHRPVLHPLTSRRSNPPVGLPRFRWPAWKIVTCCPLRSRPDSPSLPTFPLSHPPSSPSPTSLSPSPSTLEILAQSGLKYAYAHHGGMEIDKAAGDLQRCRQQLVRGGFG